MIGVLRSTRLASSLTFSALCTFSMLTRRMKSGCASWWSKVISAIRRLAELTFDHHEQHPDFIRLVSIENIHGAEHIAASEKLGRIGSPALDVIRRILAAGQESGLFTADVDAVDLHAMISSFCFFRVANRATFGALFDRDLVDPKARDHYRSMVGDMVVRFLAVGADPTAAPQPRRRR